MRKLLNPKWLFLINTLPIVTLLFLEWSEYNIIKSLLNEDSISLWKNFAITLIAFAIANAGYALIQIIHKKRIDAVYCIASLFIYTLYILTYYYNSSDIIPFNIPDWMLSGNIFMYIGAFLMPTLIHSLMSLVVMLTHHPKQESAWKNAGIAIAIPALIYTMGVIITPLWNGGASSEFVFIGGFTLTTILFLFFLLRFIYILISKKKLYQKNELLWKIPITLVLPILGLLVNDYMFSHIFGDFSSTWFYFITVLNATLLCIPAPKNIRLRLLLFGGRCITFVYTMYFFLVFLPMLPLSLVAVIIFGTGFLMLAPLVLFPVHINELAKDFDILKHSYKKGIVYLTAFAGLLVLPAITTVSYLRDRKALHDTLEYLYSPDYTKKYSIKSSSINKTLNIIDKRKGQDMFFYSSTPFLSSYYKWLVLDNLSLSNDKKRMMRNLFEGNQYPATIPASVRSSSQNAVDIKITNITHNSRYDSQQQAWISWVDLSITNDSTDLWNTEYKTTIDLPTGCWISDYYLYVEGVKEPGILAEKKAATWIFNQIRNTNRDPGLLRYISGNIVEFKVFPFQKKETRLTGIEFIHKEVVEIDIDGHRIQLGEPKIQENLTTTTKSNNVIYLSAEDKERLTTVERVPYYHFIVDMSANSENGYTEVSQKNKSKTEKYINQIDNLLKKNLIENSNAKITYTNIQSKTKSLDADWKKEIKDTKLKGGFFLDRAVKEILFNAYTNPQRSYPVIVVVSDYPTKAITFNDWTDFQFAYPESDIFYSLSNDSIRSHSFLQGIKTIIDEQVDSFPRHTVKAYPDMANPSVYLANDNKPSILLDTEEKVLDIPLDNIEKKSWTSGLQMQGQWMLQTLYPQTADEEWLALIQNSFKSGIMSPYTSYIVVENEAQKAMLKKKQEETLNGHRALDLNDNTQPMSEPDLLILIVLFGIFYLIYKRKKKRTPIY